MNPSKLGAPILKVAVRFEHDIVTARQKTRRISQFLGFHRQDQARMATAVSELARNVFQYAKTGSIEFFFSLVVPQTFYIKVTDAGPGIEALDDILNGTYVSPTGMGVGLIGTKKLMDYFDVKSTVGAGTCITIGKPLEKPNGRFISIEDLRLLADDLVAKHADNPFEEIQNQNRDLINALEEVEAAKFELSALNKELAETNRGVIALYAELDEKAASLQRANEVKTSFLSNMTHEFRTPLSSIISLTRLLLNCVDGPLTKEQEKQVHYIRQSSEGLLELVNDLLDLAKVEAGKININSSKFQIEEVLSGLRGMFRPLLNSNNSIDLLIDPVPAFELQSDQAKISQILRNLVSNAIKYTEQGAIHVTSHLDQNDLVRFSVVDTGLGIQPEFMDTIFDDFSQVDSHLQKKQKGTGLGLPLSRKLARLLGGDLWVDSTYGKGSTFHVVIPRVYMGSSEGILISRSGFSAKNPTVENPFQASSRFRVLIIDDDEASRYILKSFIKREIDAEFLEAHNGKIGLEYIRNLNPDVVFLDLAMPEMDGFTVLKHVRADDNLKGIPIVINTAKKLSPEEVKILSADATAILSKEHADEVVAMSAIKDALSRAGFDYKICQETY